MGMSSDWEMALEHGSTNIRVGSAIFGDRSYGIKEGGGGGGNEAGDYCLGEL
jgi:hypothetical protein